MSILNEISGFEIHALYVHEIPKKQSKKVQKDDEIKPEYSDGPSPFSEPIATLFKNKIIGSFVSSKAFPVVFLENNPPPTQEWIKSFLEAKNNKEKHVLTKSITKHLLDVQSAINPGGILVFISCVINMSNSFVILKLEKEEGLRVRKKSSEEGTSIFDLEHIKELMFTDKTQLFKAAVFQEIEGEIKSHMYDQQQGEPSVAMFFMSDFLGCAYDQIPEVRTRDFYVHSINYFNKIYTNSEQRAEAYQHLLSELKSHKTRINVRDFAEQFIIEEKRDDFENEIATKLGTRIFEKDTLLIQKKLEKTSYYTKKGILIKGDNDIIKEFLSIDEENGRIVINDKIGRVKN